MKKYTKPTVEVIEMDKTDILQTSNHLIDGGSVEDGKVDSSVFPVKPTGTSTTSADPFQN